MKKLLTSSLAMACVLSVSVATTRAATLAGPVINPANGYTYFLLTENTWTASESEALTLGGHLATVNDLAENQWLIGTFWPLSGVQRASLWIGLNDAAVEGTFVWASGEPVFFTHWNFGEPNNLGDEDFVHIYDQFVPYYPQYQNTPTYWNDSTDISSGEFGGQYFGVVEVVPEPSIIALSVVGAFFGLALYRRRVSYAG